MMTETWARRCAPWLACALTMVGCDGMEMTCPEGTELVEGACVAPEPDAQIGMDGATPPPEDGGPMVEPDGGPTTPDGGPMGMPDGGPMGMPDGGPMMMPDGGIPPDLPDSGTPTCPTPDTWYRDWDADGYGDPAASVESCDPVEGFVTNADDCNDTCDTCWTGASETCDMRDNDCDGTTDEGVTTTFYLDADGDGRGDPARTTDACAVPTGHVSNGDDCDDGCDTCWTGAIETCDLRDNDCNGSVDEGVTATFYRDGDGDGHGDPAMTSTGCTAPSGFVTSDTDCDDTCAACYPGNSETCDGEDNDCNGSVDEGLLHTYYRDADGDGHGDAAGSTTACTAPSGYVSSDDDCDDTCAACYPGNPETCDGEDNDCDVSVDEGVLLTFFRDADGDGWGASSPTTEACTRPSGYAERDGDCNDACATCRPFATEVCDTLDNDCDMGVDEGVQTRFYRDADGDGHGLASASVLACAAPSGHVTSMDDCDDTCAVCYPGNSEVCDGEDNDCDVDVDETVQTLYYRDGDGDGYGRDDVTQLACAPPSGFVGVGMDCDDATSSTYPSASELCNAIDDDCDGSRDETFTCVEGETTGCTTSCGSRGTGTCTTSCEEPDAAACTPPSETCNYVDDDCDGFLDERLFSVGSENRLTAPSNLSRPRTTECPDGSTCAFFVGAGQVLGYRIGSDGSVLESAIPQSGNDTFDIGYRPGDPYLYYAYIDGSSIEIRVLNPRTLVAVRTRSIARTASYLRVVVDGSHVWIYTLEGSAIRRYRLSRTFGTWDGMTRNVTISEDPFDVVVSSESGDPHYVSFVVPVTHRMVQMTRVPASGSPSTVTLESLPSDQTASDPAITTTSDGQIFVAWAVRGAASFLDNAIRYGHLERWGRPPLVGNLSGYGRNTPSIGGSPGLQIDVGHATGVAGTAVFHAAVAERAYNASNTTWGEVHAYTFQRAGLRTAIQNETMPSSSRTHEGAAVSPLTDITFGVFYEGSLSRGLWRRLGC
ncbi:MAG: putative metal-binding motif-containing protein [Myxococcota bacterium]|nr:putative metal-binding motif-containing protein [Myxococcota bacterium]